MPFDFPGVRVTEATAGAIPIDRKSFQAIKLTGTAQRGPVGLNRNPITREGQYTDLYGAPIATSYLADALRAIFTNTRDGLVYINRVVGAGATKAIAFFGDAGTPQIETATVVGTVGASGAGNMSVVITAAGMTGSPKTLAVAVANNDTASQVAAKIRAALALDVDVTARFAPGGTGAAVSLTRSVNAANDATVNIAISTGTATGITAAPTSAHTQAGVADVNILQVEAIGPGADYNYTASPAHGLSVSLADGELKVFDGGALQEFYRDVTVANAQAAADFINGNSNLVQITWLSTSADPDDVTTPTGLLTGANGAAVVATDIAGNSGTPSGVWVFNEKELPLGFVLAPGYPQNVVGTALIGVAENARQLAIIDSTLGSSQSGAVTERNGYASPKGHAIYSYGWVQVIDQISGAKKYAPRSPYRAAHIARSHSQPGFLANVGAGLDYTLRGVIGLETSLMDDPQQGVLNVKGIDVARNFAAFGQGLVHWAARTISTNPLYRFLQVRVIFNVIAESIELGLRPYVFRAYDGRGRLGNEMKGSIDGLLWDLWNRETLFGRTAAEAFKTILASSLNELEQGIVNIDVYVKPTPIVERIDVTLFRVPLNFDFNTGQVTIGDIESRA